MSKIIDNKDVLFGIFVYMSISLIIIFYNHSFYFDELYNIRLIQLSFYDLFHTVQNNDVHPPLSYLFNKVIYEIFNSYKAILIFLALFNAFTLAYFYRFASKQFNNKQASILLFFAIFLGSGLLYYGNTLRWLSLWIPLFIILYTYLLKYQTLTIKNIVFIAVLLSVMTYINYLSFIVLIATSCVIFIREKYTFKKVAIINIIYLILSGYQIYIFATIHIIAKDSQTFGIMQSIFYAFYGIINGAGVIPIHPLLLIVLVLSSILVIISIYNFYKHKQNINPLFAQTLLFSIVIIILFIATGVAGKTKNSVALTVPFYFMVAYLLTVIKNISFKNIYLLSIIAISILGVLNLTTRQDTFSNAYNKPLAKLANFVQKDNSLIFTSDEMVNFYLEQKDYNVYNLLQNKKEIQLKKNWLIYWTSSYQRPDTAKSKLIYKRLESCIEVIQQKNLGIDKYFKFKNKILNFLKINKKFDKVQINILYGKLKKDCYLPAWTK